MRPFRVAMPKSVMNPITDARKDAAREPDAGGPAREGGSDDRRAVRSLERQGIP
jgi:hypothetical protein